MRRTTFLTALLCSLAATGTADAAFRPLEPSARGVLTDGERFAVIERADGSFAVIDDEGPSRGLVRPACPDAAVTPRLAAVGSGLAAFECAATPNGPAAVRLVDLATAGVYAVAGFERLGTSQAVGAVGRRWLRVGVESRGALNASTVYLNWHTGEVRQDNAYEKGRRRVYPDLDRALLDHRLCRGVRRRTVVVEDFAEFEAPFEYRDRHGLSGMRLLRCGGKRARALSGAKPFGARLAPGRVTWARGSQLHVRALRPGARTVRLDIPPGATHLPQTRRYIFAVTPGSPGVQISRAPRG